MDNTDDQLRARVTTKDLVTKDLVAVGQTIDGQFAVIRQIGKGGMGRVFLAEDLKLGARKVAVKIIDFPTNDEERQLAIIERFRREALAAAKVTHPNVIAIHAFKEIEGQHVQVMEYVDGRTLKEELTAQPRKAFEPERAVRIVIEFLEGVAAMHEKGIYHRDLKPANVMLTHAGDRVKILDLGLVKFAESVDPATDMTLTQCGTPMGSPLYMAPEQINALPDAREIDMRTDLYAVGVILFQLLTGKPPFMGKGDRSLFDQHRFDQVPKMESPFGELSPALQAIVTKAMAKKSSDRYQTADKMREALERLLKPREQKRSLASTLGLASIGPLVIAVIAIALRFGHSAAPAPAAKAPTVEAVATPHREAPPPPAAKTATPPVSKEAIVISVPPPAEAVIATAKAGCQAFTDGRTSDATAILTKVVAASPKDLDALFCLCGSYAAKSSLASGERGVCQDFLKHAPQSDARKYKVKIWLGWKAK